MPKNNAPTFSIVTPSYNQARFIEETIESVISQKGDFYIQYIIGDAGSKDGSVDIIKRYDKLVKSKGFKPNCLGVTIEWWSKKDKGQSDAINKGFKKATGEYLAWLNSDDVYYPGAMAAALKEFDKDKNLGLVYTDFEDIDAESKHLENRHADPFDLERIVHVGNMVPQPASFMLREAAKSVGFLNEKYHYAMDYDLWIRIGQKYTVKKTKGCWAKFRLHDESKTVSLEKKFWKEVWEISRKNGADITSPIFINHYFSVSPFLMTTINRIGRIYRMLRQGNFKLFGEKLARNLQFWKKK
jgi:glycosyltransferase involved in cell wall biosynthesis